MPQIPILFHQSRLSNNLLRSDYFAPSQIKSDRVVRQIIRSGERDANGARLNPAGVDLTRFSANPVLLYEHSSQIIGRVLSIEKRNDLLIADLEYDTSEIASEVLRMDKSGFMPGASCGWVPKTFKQVTDGIDVETWELLEVSKVHIPADALALSEPIVF